MAFYQESDKARMERAATRSGFSTTTVDISVPRFQAVVVYVENGVTRSWTCAHEHLKEASAQECTRWAQGNLEMGYDVYGTEEVRT